MNNVQTITLGIATAISVITAGIAGVVYIRTKGDVDKTKIENTLWPTTIAKKEKDSD